MPTLQQIEQFKKKARAKGFSESQIDAEVTRKLQSEARIAVDQPQKQDIPKTITPTAPQAPKKQGFVDKALDFVGLGNTAGNFKLATNTTATKDTVERADKTVKSTFKKSRDYIQQAKAEKDPDKKKKLLAISRAMDAGLDTAGMEAQIASEDLMTEGRVKETDLKKSNARFAIERGLKQSAELGSYALPAGKGVKAAIGMGVLGGGLQGYAQGDDVGDIAKGAAAGGVIGGVFGLAGKALKSEAAKRVGSWLVDTGEDIQLSAYTKNLGKPTKVEGGKELLQRMKKIGIKAADPDSVVDQANKILTDDGSVVFQATKELSEQGKTVDVQTFIDDLEKQIATAKSSVTKKPLQEVLEIVKGDLAGKTSITPEDLYLLKTEYGGLGRWTSLSSAVEKQQAEAWRDLYIKMNGALDNTLKENGFADFRAINDRVHTAMQASQYAARAGNVAPNKYNIGLYDWMAGLSGAATGGLPMAFGAVATKKALESPVTSQILGNILKRAGDASTRINIPEKIIGTARNAATAGTISGLSPVLGINQGEETTNQETNTDEFDNFKQDTPPGETDTEDIIPQTTDQSTHPMFGKLSKQEVVQAAFKSGLNVKQIEEIKTLYDTLAPEGDLGATKTSDLLSQRKSLVEQGFSSAEIDSELKKRGIVSTGEATAGKLTEVQQARVDVKNLVDDAITQLETTKPKTGPIEPAIENAKSVFNAGDEATLDFGNTIAQIKATLAKARAGTSFTPNEEKLLNKYAPTEGDSEQQLRTKLKGLKNFFANKEFKDKE